MIPGLASHEIIVPVVESIGFDSLEVPTSVLPNSPLAPQWYRLKDKKGEG